MQRSWLDRLAHATPHGLPPEPWTVLSDLEPAPDIASRVLRAYQKAVRDFTSPSSRGNLWDVIAQSYQSEFFAVLSRAVADDDAAELDAYLAGMFRRDATHGTCQGLLEWQILQAPAERDVRLAEYKDKLVSLAETVAARTVENPEQGAWGVAIYTSGTELVASIERAIGIEFRPPPIDGGLVKLATAQGSYHERDLYALCTAWTLGQNLGRNAITCEIGGGVGKAAYWATRLRTEPPPAGSPAYTIIDLPHIGVTQGYHLLRAGLRVQLYGEKPEGPIDVELLPPGARDLIDDSRFEVVLNQDSFPELDRADVLDYLAWMRSASAKWFYSVNHENRPPAPTPTERPQLSVPELCAAAGGFTRVLRSPYWLRRGYVAELYQISPA